MARVDKTIATHLGTTIASLTLATNLFNGPVVPGNDLAVFCTLNGGPAPFMHLAQSYEKYSNVRVIVRSAPRGYGAALDLAQEVWTALQGQRQLDADWVDLLMVESEPQYLGMDDDDHHLWQMTAQVHSNETLT
jgi:hypothetical protein